jgi:hypothetical protein
MPAEPELLGVVVWSDEPDALWLQYRSLGLRRRAAHTFPALTVLPAAPPALPAGTVAPCWRVDDLEAAIDQWESQGARILGPIDISPYRWQLAQDREGGMALWLDRAESPTGYPAECTRDKSIR